MKAFYTFFIFTLTVAPIFGQVDDPDPSKKNEPREKIDVKREFDENGNIMKYDSSYSWSWSGDDFMDEEMRQKFQDKMEQLREDMEIFSDEFISGFHWDDDFLEGFEKFHENFKMQFNDSSFHREHKERIEQFFDHHDFEFHGFNFDDNNLEVMPFDKEKMKEIEKRMQDLFNGEFDERIKQFIEEHKKEIDEIKYQIRESIPKHRKAI